MSKRLKAPRGVLKRNSKVKSNKDRFNGIGGLMPEGTDIKGTRYKYSIKLPQVYLVEYEERFLFFKAKTKLLVTDNLEMLVSLNRSYNLQSLFRSIKLVGLYKTMECTRNE